MPRFRQGESPLGTLEDGDAALQLLDPATLRRRASLRTGQYVNVLAFVAMRLTHGPRPAAI